MKVSVVNSAGGSFCWTYGTDTLYGNYAGDNICCIYPGFEEVLSVTGYVGGSYFLQMTLMQLTVSAANMGVTIFIVLMQI